ncbi:MAG: glycosyltransferase family 2 protein [Lachnospiraceae bacterium]|nr:glycosyltransferase family 2 protein [Lachnospiraceae bacterium]
MKNNSEKDVRKKIVIIPAFNEEFSIVRLCDEIREKAKDYDIIVVNDCSEDSTYNICYENNIKVLDLPVNLGIGGAVQSGYRYAAANGYDYAVQIDGDGQHNAMFLKDMYNTLANENADMVIGSRFLKNEGFQSTLLRRLGIRYFSWLIRLMTGQTITDPTSGFRMVGKKLIREFAEDYPQDYPEPESIVRVLKQGKRVVETPVVMRNRMNGRSSIRLMASVYYMIKVTIAIALERMRNS